MRPTIWLASALAAVCAIPVPTQAQSVPFGAAQPGRHVRVTQCEGYRCRWVTGELLEFGSDTVRLRVTGDSTLALPWSEGQRIQERVGTRGHALPGLAIGGGLGLGFGALVSAFLIGEDVECSACAPVFIGAGTLAGAALGLLVGAVIRTARWADLPVDRLAIGPIRAPARVGIAVRIPVRVALRL